MSALPITLAQFKPSPSPARVESAKPVTSVTHARSASPRIPSRLPVQRPATMLSLSKEPEDARITGGTRSLDRRLLALNLSGSRSEKVEN